MKLSELVVRTAEAGAGMQRPDGSFPPGHNGPYGDPETPVRNTAHWSITLFEAARLSGQPMLFDAARHAASYLLEPEARPMAAAFLCRTNPEKDFSNGLIGQAWVIEALVTAARETSESCFLDLAREVFLRHRFSAQDSVWHRLDVDGSQAPIDRTFNHQLWFAAAGAMIDSSPEDEIGSMVRRFLDGIQGGLLRCHPTGRIEHSLGPLDTWAVTRRALGSLLRRSSARLRQPTGLADKEIGYHAFNLYGFALLHGCIPDHRLWRWPRLLRCLRFVEHPDFEASINGTYGGPYNPVGFETAFALERFSEIAGLDRSQVPRWIRKQLDHCYRPSARLMERNTTDPATLAARFYEVTRLEDLDIDV